MAARLSRMHLGVSDLPSSRAKGAVDVVFDIA
jgi:hypothetical protein